MPELRVLALLNIERITILINLATLIGYAVIVGYSLGSR